MGNPLEGESSLDPGCSSLDWRRSLLCRACWVPILESFTSNILRAIKQIACLQHETN
ncbi:hypothetical protein LINGRAHAP2_LOCUS8080, partial [Linum grandiflorum]